MQQYNGSSIGGKGVATIYLIHRIEGTEAEIHRIGVAKIQALLDQLQPGLEQVKQSCEAQFPNLSVEWSDRLDMRLIDYDSPEEGIWEIHYMFGVITTSPDGMPEKDYQVDEFDRWQQLDNPLHQEVAEYVRDADWSLIQPLCGGDGGTLGDLVDVQFDVLRAVESYKHEGYHFYNNSEWL